MQKVGEVLIDGDNLCQKSKMGPHELVIHLGGVLHTFQAIIDFPSICEVLNHSLSTSLSLNHLIPIICVSIQC